MSGAEQGGQTEAEWIRLLQQGQSAAFDALFDRYRAKLRAYVYGMIRDRGLSDDIVQDVFLTLIRKAGSLRPERGAAAWLYRVSRNRCIDHLRRRRRESAPGNERVSRCRESREDASAQRPDRQAMCGEQAAWVEAALDRLPPAERELLILRYYGDLTFREAASVLRRPLGTVLWQARRALGRMRSAAQTEGLEGS